MTADLPRIETVIEPEGNLTDCKKIGEEITEIMELEMPKLIVQRFVRPKYVTADGRAFLIGELPSRPIEKGMAGPKLLSHVVVSKYVDHLPVYRQVKQLKRWGIELADSTVYGWITSTCNLLEPLYACLKLQVLNRHYLQADESPHLSISMLTPNQVHYAKDELNTNRLWKNYYSKDPMFVNSNQD